MGIRRKRAAREPRLDPLRWRVPGRATLLRAGLTAALLLTAAGALYAGGDQPSNPPPAGGTAAPRTGRTDRPGSGTADRPATGTGGASETRVTGGASEAAALPVPDGLVGVPVRMAESAILAVVQPGDRIDLLAVSADDGRAATVAPAVLVLGVIGAADPAGEPAGLYLALTRDQAARAITLGGRARFAALVRP